MELNSSAGEKVVWGVLTFCYEDFSIVEDYGANPVIKNTPYYFLPGGRVQLHEPAEIAIVRELREELNVEPKVLRPLWLNQGFFTEDVSGERFHEICLYFLMDVSHTDLLSKGEQFVLSENNQRHTFEWLRFDRLKDEYFYPVFLKEKILDLPETLTILANFD